MRTDARVLLLTTVVLAGFSPAHLGAADFHYCPKYVVGQWNGVWWHYCLDCTNPNNYVYTSDTRIHAVSDGCPCTDGINYESYLTSEKKRLDDIIEKNRTQVANLQEERMKLETRIDKLLEKKEENARELQEAKDKLSRTKKALEELLAPRDLRMKLNDQNGHADPKGSTKIAPDLRARPTRHVSQRKDADGKSEDPEDNFIVIASDKFKVIYDDKVRVRDDHLAGTTRARYFRLLEIKPIGDLKAGTTTVDSLRIGQELDRNDLNDEDVTNKATYYDHHDEHQMVINFGGKDWHVLMMLRFKKP